MKNLLKFLPVAMIALTFASCGEKKDWTCDCADTVTNIVSATSVITDSTEKDAEKECDSKDVLVLGVGLDCSLAQ